MPINQRDIPHQQKKRQNHMIVSIDGEKAFDKIQHPFMIKKSYQSGDRRNIYQINKSYFMTNSQLNSEKLKILPAKIRNKTKPLSPFLVNRVLIPSHRNQTRKKNKRYPEWKGRGKIVIICR